MKIEAKDIRLVDVDTISPNPKNRNKHSPEQIERLKAIIEYQGFRVPIIISTRSGKMVAGHGRVLAAKELGIKELPAIYQDFESEEQEYAAGVSDNSIAAWAELDLSGINADLPELAPFDIDLLGIKDFVVDMAEKDAEGEDDVPEPPKEAKSKRGELWILGEHRVLCGDSTDKGDVERLMAGEKADMVFTSPPYLDLRDYGGGLDLTTEALSKLFDFPADTYFVNLGLIIRDREIIRYWDGYFEEAAKRGLKLLAWNVWDKGNASAPAHQQAMFGLCHEWVFVFGNYREINRTVQNQSEQWGTATTRERDGSLTHRRHGKVTVRSHRQLDSVLPLEPQKNYSPDYTGHPAAFPVSLPEEYIAAATNGGDLVVDPFLGSGSTLIACEKTKRRCFGMEIDPIYIDVILDRWAKYTGKEPKREDGTPWSYVKDGGD